MDIPSVMKMFIKVEHFPPEFVECIFVSNGDGAGAAGNNGL